MKRQQAFKLAVLSGSAVLLQGCIAAVVPLAAGGLLTRSSTGDGGEGVDPVETVVAEQPAPAPVAASSPEVETAIAENVAIVEAQSNADLQANADASAEAQFVVAEEEASIVEVEPEVVATAAAAEESTPLAENPAVVEAPAPAATIAASEADAALAADLATSAPASAGSGISAAAADAAIAADISTASAPSPAPVASTAAASVQPAASIPSQGAVTLFDPLVNYANAQQSISGDGRISAMLSDPASLRPGRIACDSSNPTVLVDLDPEGENLPIGEQLSAPSALGVKLAQMRAQGINIAWISQVSADQEGAIRAALTRSGLDLAGTDQLLLMRTADERKQSRRDELAKGTCVVAIAGDTRSDFHELFDYLLNPNDAFALQPLIGDGWFIIPTPLLPEGLNR